MRLLYIATSLSALLVAGCGDGRDQQANRAAIAESSAPNSLSTPEVAASSDVQNDAQDVSSINNLTPPQINAVRSAEQYLAMTGFSRLGLIGQLSSDAGDGYSVSDATVAVDSLDVDWNENAARSARQYLDMTGFSCRGLIEQLSSSSGDEYTVSQARYGAQQAGAC